MRGAGRSESVGFECHTTLPKKETLFRYPIELNKGVDPSGLIYQKIKALRVPITQGYSHNKIKLCVAMKYNIK